MGEMQIVIDIVPPQEKHLLRSDLQSKVLQVLQKVYILVNCKVPQVDSSSLLAFSCLECDSELYKGKHGHQSKNLCLIQELHGRHESRQWGRRMPLQRLLCSLWLHGRPAETKRADAMAWHSAVHAVRDLHILAGQVVFSQAELCARATFRVIPARLSAPSDSISESSISKDTRCLPSETLTPQHSNILLCMRTYRCRLVLDKQARNPGTGRNGIEHECSMSGCHSLHRSSRIA